MARQWAPAATAAPTVQVGLLAEEVQTVYPGAVARGADGRPQGISYDALARLVLQEAGTRMGATLPGVMLRLAERF